MSHGNAMLSPAGRLLMVQRVARAEVARAALPDGLRPAEALLAIGNVFNV